MNLLRKQGFYNSITLYLGTVLGFLNLIILFQRSLSLEEIGFFNLMIAISLLYVQITTLGFTNVITKYFPYFRTADNKHNGFPVLIFGICVASFVLITIGFLWFKEMVMKMHAEDKGSSLLATYYNYIIPVSFCLMIFTLQEIFSRTVFKTIFPTFLREVVLRVFTSVGIFLIMFKVIDYGGFIIYYLCSQVAMVLIITYYNYRIRSYRIAKISKEVKSNLGSMMKFGMFSMLGGSSFTLVQNLDVIILRILSDEATIGIYSTFFFIAVVISLPSKALNTTSYQMIADAWKELDLKKINRIYHKTSVVQFLIGSLLLIGLIANKNNLLYLLHKEEYGAHFNVFIIIGLGFLADITGGLNGTIISYSKHYKVVMVGLGAAAIICAILNFILIPYFGMVGAALSYLLTMFSLNLIYWYYLKVKFDLQPFGSEHFLIVIVSVVCLAAGMLIPQLSNHYFDAISRSVIIAIIYVSLSWYLKISPDINEVIDKVLLKFKLIK